MAGFPAPNSNDPEDVTWALETAAALWRRGDRGDALSWVKRAAQAAGEAGLDDRALELARQAADLAEPAPTSGDIEVDLDASGDDEIAEIEELEAVEPAPPPARPAGPPKPPPRAAPPRPPPPARPAAPAASAPGAAPPAASSPAAALPLSPDLTPAAAPAALRPAGKPASLPTGAAPAAPAFKPPTAAMFTDESTQTEWPPPSAASSFPDSKTDVSWPVREPLPSLEETVTEWPPRGAAELLDSLRNIEDLTAPKSRAGAEDKAPEPAPAAEAPPGPEAPAAEAKEPAAPAASAPAAASRPGLAGRAPGPAAAPRATGGVARPSRPEVARGSAPDLGKPGAPRPAVTRASAPEISTRPSSEPVPSSGVEAMSRPASTVPSPQLPAPVSGAEGPRVEVKVEPAGAEARPAAEPASMPGKPASGEASPWSQGKPRSKQPAQIDIDDDWFEASGPPTFRPQENPHRPAVPLADLLQKRPGESLAPPPTSEEVAAQQAIVVPPSAPPGLGPAAPAPGAVVQPESIGSPPPTQKISIPPELLQASLPQTLGLDDLPQFGDIPVEHRATFFAAAKRKTLNERDFVRGFALGVVLRGEAQVTGFNSEVVVARLRAGSVLRARGTAGKALPMRLSAKAGGCDVVTWSEAPLNATFQSCPWVDGELRASSNQTLGLVGAASGVLGSLEVKTLEKLSEWLQPRVLGAGEVALHEGEPTPPLVVVGTGTIEIVRGGGAAERTLGPGELVTPADCARGARAAVTARAGAEGAVVMVVDKARRQAMEAALPAVIALLTGL